MRGGEVRDEAGAGKEVEAGGGAGEGVGVREEEELEVVEGGEVRTAAAKEDVRSVHGRGIV